MIHKLHNIQSSQAKVCWRKNKMKGLGLASLDALDCHAWGRKIVGDMCRPRFAWSSSGILPKMSRPLNDVCVSKLTRT